jgi:hypothetical protein
MVKDQLKVSKRGMVETFKNFWTKFMHLGQSWKVLKSSMSKQFLNFIKLHPDKGIAVFMRIISDTFTLEFQSEKNVFDTSASLFKVFYDLCMMNGKDDIVKKFYEAFEITIRTRNQLFRESIDF